MGCCTGRCLLITICVLQFITTVERQVFDFLGYMWAPIIANFIHVLIIILGFFGAVQYRPRIVAVYAASSLFWLGWNIFVICIYLEVGSLSRNGSILNIGTDNKSWWLENGIGCKVTNTSWMDGSHPPETSRHIPPEEDVEGCLLQYYYVEIIHAGIQCILTLMGFIFACYVIYVFTEEDDSYWESQPVHDELEYIKMLYKSPARSSFRDNKMYATLTTQSTAYSTMSRGGVDGPNYSDDSTERLSQHQPQQQYRHSQRGQVQQGLHVPWQPDSPIQQTDITMGMTQIPEDEPLPDTPSANRGSRGRKDRSQQRPDLPSEMDQGGGGGPHGQYPPEQPYTYNIIGQTQGVTVI